MSHNLSQYLCEMPFMRVLRGLYSEQNPVHLRELVRRYDLSPGGVADILRRLEELGLLVVQNYKNRKLYSLKLREDERQALSALFKLYEADFIARRKKTLERNATKTLKWMDETYVFLKKAKRLNAHSS